MAIRLNTTGSKIYHLQGSGHAYWLTRCQRVWLTLEPRAQHMSEVSAVDARGLRLCKSCRIEWEQRYRVELEGAA